MPPDEPTTPTTPEPAPPPTQAPPTPTPEPAPEAALDYSGLTAPGALKLAPDDLAAITATAAQHKLAPEGLTELLTKLGEQRAASDEAFEKTIAENRAKQATEWVEQAKAEYGQKFEESVALANKVLNEFADEDFRQWLDEYGLRMAPPMQKMLLKIAKATGEAPLLAGSPAPAAVDWHKVSYPNSPSMWDENQVARN